MRVVIVTSAGGGWRSTCPHPHTPLTHHHPPFIKILLTHWPTARSLSPLLGYQWESRRLSRRSVTHRAAANRKEGSGVGRVGGKCSPPPSSSLSCSAALRVNVLHERRRLAAAAVWMDGDAPLCATKGGQKISFTWELEGRVPAAEVEWRVSNVRLYLVRRQRPHRVHPVPGKKNCPLCGVQQVAPVRPLLIFMKWMVCSARGRLCVCVCVYLYVCTVRRLHKQRQKIPAVVQSRPCVLCLFLLHCAVLCARCALSLWKT